MEFNSMNNDKNEQGGIASVYIKRGQVIYVKYENQDQNICNSKCEIDDLCTLPAKTSVQHRKSCAKPEHQPIKCGVFPSSSESVSFSCVNSPADNVVSSTSVVNCAKNVETDSSTETDKSIETVRMWNEGEPSIVIDSMINDQKSLLNYPSSEINFSTLSANLRDSVKLMATNSKPSRQQVPSDCQQKAKIISLDSLESVGPQFSSHLETVPNDDIPDSCLSSPDTSTTTDTDTVLGKIQIQDVHSYVPSQKDMLHLESKAIDNREKGLTVLGVNNLDETSFGDADGLVVSDSIRLCNVEVNEKSEVLMTESQTNNNIELGCSQDNLEGVLQTMSPIQSKTKHTDYKYSAEDGLDTQIAMGEAQEDPETEKILPRQRASLLYQDEEPVLISHSELMERYDKHSRENMKQKKKQKEVIQRAESSSMVMTPTKSQSEIKHNASKNIEHDEPDLPSTVGAAKKDSKEQRVLQIQSAHSDIKHYDSENFAYDDTQLAIGTAAEDSEAEKAFPNQTDSLFYHDEEPVHISHSELMERYDKHSKEFKRQKKKQKEVKQRAKSPSMGIVSNSGVKIGGSFFKRTFIHPFERKLKRHIMLNARQSRDVNTRFDEPVTLPETSKIGQSSDYRRRNNFLDSLKDLKNCGWYWGPLSYDEAVNKLINKPHGSFLVRDSYNELYLLSVSFILHGFVHHIRIEHHNGKFSFWADSESHEYSSIKELIEESVKKSHKGHSDFTIGNSSVPVYFLHPVSRFLQMHSLQHICRFKILQNVRRDHIDRLPIPRSIKDYLKVSQYYVEYLED